MAKKTDSQITELTLKNAPKEVTDPETGKKIKVTQDMITAFVGAERQALGGFEMIALALHKIRSEKLYLIVCDTLTEYMETRFSHSPSLGYHLLRMADVFGDSKNFTEIMQQPRKLLEMAVKSEDLKKQLKDGEITLPDGSVVTLKELKKSVAMEMATDLDIAKKDLKAEKRKSRDLAQQLEEKGKLVEHYEAGMAEGDFKKLTAKKEILSELFAMDAQVAEIVKRLDSIESEDPQVVSKLESVLTQLLSGAGQVQNKWMHLILSTTPDPK